MLTPSLSKQLTCSGRQDRVARGATWCASLLMRFLVVSFINVSIVFFQDVLPGLIGYCQEGMTKGTVHFDDVLSIFVSLLLHKSPPSAGYAATNSLLHPYTIDFRPEIKRLQLITIL